MIYFDNSATSPLLPEVLDRMAEVGQEIFGNPSSLHMAGREAARLLRESKVSIGHILGVQPTSLTFTSGGSEANNTAIIGYALANQSKGKHLVTTAIEHPSVLEAFNYLRTHHGFTVTQVKPFPNGELTSDLIMAALRPDTLLVSMMMVNNETGQILPVAEVGCFLAHKQAAFHVDAVQAVGKIPVKPEDIKADFLSATAHKFHGPKGVGFLYHRPGLKFDSLILGGDQEDGHRAGTENLMGIAGMTRALEIADQKMVENFNTVKDLNHQLLVGLGSLPHYLNMFSDSLPHIINLGIPGSNHDLLLTQLDLAQIAVSAGSACSAGNIEPSHVLAAVYGEDSDKLYENIRISLSELNTAEEVEIFISKVKSLSV